MMTEKQLANLRPFSSTHQPKNRVKRGASPITFIKKYITKKIKCPDPISKAEVNLAIGEIIGLQWLSKAMKGDSFAIRDLLDRLDGAVLGSPTVTPIIIFQDKEEKQESSENDPQ